MFRKLTQSIKAALKTRNFPGSRDGGAMDIGDALFVPLHYAIEAGLSIDTPAVELHEHFLAKGMALGLSPSPLFQPGFVEGKLPAGDKSKSVFERWRQSGMSAGVIPTSRFDPEFYLAANPDVAKAGASPFGHFVLCGMQEQRRPNAVFDSAWYQKTYARKAGEENLPPYLHYLMFGAARGLAPARLLVPIFSHVADPMTGGLDRYDLAVKTISPWADSIGLEKTNLILALFMSFCYGHAGKPEREANGVERLAHFLDHGLMRGLDPGPLFNSVYFSAQMAKKLRRSKFADVPLMQFLKKGREARIVPNDMFDETSYRSFHSDIANSHLWGFEHFILHGIFEGRKVQGLPSIAISRKPRNMAERQLDNWLSFWVEHAPDVPKTDLPPEFRAARNRMTEVFKSDVFRDVIAQARSLEPLLGDVMAGGDVLMPPTHDVMNDLAVEILARLPRKRYHSIVCVPWVRAGGADLVACQLAGAVLAARPEEHVLLLRVDQPHLERPDWVPAGVDMVHISDLAGSVAPSLAEALLRSVFLGLNPLRIFNVNSNLAWRTLVRFGSRMSSGIHLYAYLFCWDQTADGMRVGYPSEFFPPTSPFLKATLTDTEYLRDELFKLYRPPAEVRSRIVPLFSPARTQPPSIVFAAAGAAARVEKRPRILWAGRLDRQKRFDLVQAIARMMPDVDFVCWGAALLDAPPDLTLNPANLVLNASFHSYDELPLKDCSLWLFTSAWEGMPTILIEIAIRGMSVVGSMVGGVPELLSETTGYPVYEIGSPDAYVEAIRSALDNTEEQIVRARALQRRALSRYTKTAYHAQIFSLLARES